MTYLKILITTLSARYLRSFFSVLRKGYHGLSYSLTPLFLTNETWIYKAAAKQALLSSHKSLREHDAEQVLCWISNSSSLAQECGGHAVGRYPRARARASTTYSSYNSQTYCCWGSRRREFHVQQAQQIIWSEYRTWKVRRHCTQSFILRRIPTIIIPYTAAIKPSR